MTKPYYVHLCVYDDEIGNNENEVMVYNNMYSSIHNTLGNKFPLMVREFMDIEILQSTQDFGMLIGKGGFGYVYRGVYHGTDVAVKRFNKVYLV